MIEQALYFVLGFAAASFLALLIAPAIWRRAVFLTRKRVESAVPLSANELKAEKDQMRAQSALAYRKLEMKHEAQTDRLADQEAQVGRLTETVKALTAELEDTREKLITANRHEAEQETDLAEQKAEIGTLALQLETTQADLAARSGELETFKRMVNEHKKRLAIAEERQAQTSKDYATARNEITALREKRREDQAKIRDHRSKAKQAEQDLKGEVQKVKSLEERLEKAIRTQTDLEEKAARFERQLGRTQNVAAQKKSDTVKTSSAGEEKLRQQVNQLAAEMVHLTALLEGDASPIDDLIAQDKDGHGDHQSLANRIQALRAQVKKAAE